MPPTERPAISQTFLQAVYRIWQQSTAQDTLGENVLNARELEILQLVAQGLANRQVGERLFLADETVKWYLKHIYRKLGVGNRTSAVTRARALGLIS